MKGSTEEPVQTQWNEGEEADLLIGLPTYNHAATIPGVLEAVAAGAGRYFPEARTVLMVSDGGSTDGSQEKIQKARFQNLRVLLFVHAVPPIEKFVPPCHGIPGKESALKRILNTAQSLKVKACAVMDPGLKSVTPEWVRLLLGPPFEEGFDFIAPLYARHPFEGTITNSIIYPLTRALYGKRIYQPMGGDFSLSREFIRDILSQIPQGNEAAMCEIELFISTLAMTAGYKIGQSFLGPRIHNFKDAGSDLGTIFTEVVFSAFRLMETHQGFWKDSQESQPVPTFGHPVETPGAAPFNVERMVANFRLGARALTEIWRKVLSPKTVRGVEAVNRMPAVGFSFPQDLWVQVIYDFAVGFHRGMMHRDHLLKSMIPLYLGWVASFFKENREASASAVEKRIESLCQSFEKQKPYLVERWGS